MDPSVVWKWTAQKDGGACAVCNKISTNRCTRCKTVYYCSKEHQTMHWKTDHKDNCGLIELTVDPVIGRHYIAKRRIEPGEVVLHEKKMIVTFSNKQSEIPLCLNCHDIVLKEYQKNCNKCGWWPLCPKCTRHGPECEFTNKYGNFEGLVDNGNSIKQNWDVQNSLLLGIIRVIALRDTKPKLFSKIMKFEDSIVKWKKMAGSDIDESLGKLIKKCFNINHLEEAEIAKIARILYINGIEFRVGETGIAEKATHFEHSCYPNCSFSVSDLRNGTIRIWAVREIAPGEHVSISYQDPTDGTITRQERLLKTKFSGCHCQRCEDPSEFGSMFNAIKCTVDECGGYMLPPSFKLSDGRYPDFVCLKCKAEFISEDVITMHEDMEAHLFSLDTPDVDGWKAFLDDYKDVVHPNHYLMIKAKLSLANIIGFDAYIDPEKADVPIDVINEKIKLSEELINILEAIMPGYAIGKGRLLYGIGVSMSKIIKESNDPNERRILLPKTRAILKEACKWLCYEDPNSSQGLLGKQALQMLLLLIITTDTIENTDK